MDDKHIIASSLYDNELARAFSELVAERWDNMDLSPYLAYLVDVCAPTALPYLAEQFDIDGLRGFGMAADEQQQRDLIKRSIALHKYIGTPWAIREACRTVGFPVIVLEEGGTAIKGGPSSPEDWARFRVLVEANERYITSEEARKLRLFVEFYKNERSQLVELGFYQAYYDEHLYRPDVPDRDELDIITVSIAPNPVMLSPSGRAKQVSVNISAAWNIEVLQYEWPDGSGDKVYLQFTGESGISTITVTSDHVRNTEREIMVPIKSNGRFLCNLTIKQDTKWKAYCRGYSAGYSRIDK